jgi:hypothetical protein
MKHRTTVLEHGSKLLTEKAILSFNDTSESIAYHPIMKWTNQPNMPELLDKKLHLRNTFSMNIDFLDYKRPLLANAYLKIERLEAADTQ